MTYSESSKSVNKLVVYESKQSEEADSVQTLRWSAEADRFDSVGIFVQLNYEEGVP